MHIVFSTEEVMLDFLSVTIYFFSSPYIDKRCCCPRGRFFILEVNRSLPGISPKHPGKQVT